MSIRVSAVSYTNSKPFIDGLQRAGDGLDILLSLDIPSQCATKLISGQADVGLVPVAALPDIPDYRIISDYCIGARGAVNSVFIFSHKPVEAISTLCPDEQSRTSNLLAAVLLKHHWKRDVSLQTDGDADAFVQIGDRTFGKAADYPYAYDLAAAWYDYTGLPFTFAVWAANKELPASFISRFNAALEDGLAHRQDTIATLEPVRDFDMEDYLLNRIDYMLDEPKKVAISRFLSLIR